MSWKNLVICKRYKRLTKGSHRKCLKVHQPISNFPKIVQNCSFNQNNYFIVIKIRLGIFWSNWKVMGGTCNPMLIKAKTTGYFWKLVKVPQPTLKFLKIVQTIILIETISSGKNIDWKMLFNCKRGRTWHFWKILKVRF